MILQLIHEYCKKKGRGKMATKGPLDMLDTYNKDYAK